MKKWRLPAFALVALLVFGAVPALAGPTNYKRYDSTLSVKYKQGNSNDPYKPYKHAKFKGKVNAPNKKFCEKSRKVKVTLRNTGATVGSDFTDKQGKYEIPAKNFGPGKYEAKAVKKHKSRHKKIKHGKQKGEQVTIKVICKPETARLTVR